MHHITFSKFSDYFLVVAKTGSLRKAADQLFISASAIHRQIALAEEELGVELFERFPNGMRLTLAGELLYADLLKWQKEFGDIRNRFDEIQGLKRGVIKIAAIEALAEGLLVNCMEKMTQAFPWINIEVNIEESERVAEKVIHSDVDFGLLFEPKQHSSLEVLSFVEIPLGLAFSPLHPLACNKNFKLSDTLDYKHIIANKPLMIQDRIESIYQHHHLNPLQHIECNNIEMIRSLLKRNLGVSILSYLDVINTIKNNELNFFPLKIKNIQPLTFALCIAPRRQLSKAAQVMIKYIMAEMQSIDSNGEPNDAYKPTKNF